MNEIESLIGLELCMAPAGSFLRGSAEYDADRELDEGPQNLVTFKAAFLMGKYPVTQAEYQTVMGENPSHFKGYRNPVERVSWNEAVAFCEKLTKLEHENGNLPLTLEYRLPSESEWEYACRANTAASRYGDLDEIAWCMANSGGKPHPVGEKDPNAWGIYDMLGNVWEWCQDTYHENYQGAPSDGSVWRTGGGPIRVLRGGSWNYLAGFTRAANRFRGGTAFRNYAYGFRVAVGQRDRTSNDTSTKYALVTDSHDLFRFTCSTKKKCGLYLSWSGQGTGCVDLDKIKASLRGVLRDDIDLLTQLAFDGWAILLFDTLSEADDAYTLVDDTDGEIYALTCTADGVLQTEKT